MTLGPLSSTPYTDWPDLPMPQFPLLENREWFPTHGLEGWFRRINSCKRFRAWYMVTAQSELNYYYCCCWLPYKVLFTMTSCLSKILFHTPGDLGCHHSHPPTMCFSSQHGLALPHALKSPPVSPAHQAFKRTLEAVTSVKPSLTTPVLGDLPASAPQTTYVTSFPHHMTHLKGPWPCLSFSGWRQIMQHPRACAQCSEKPCPVPMHSFLPSLNT